MTTALEDLLAMYQKPIEGGKAHINLELLVDRIHALMPKERETHNTFALGTASIDDRTVDFLFNTAFPTHPTNTVTEEQSNLCSCGKNPVQAPHSCPYKSDINGDDETLCTCCAECEHECAMDI